MLHASLLIVNIIMKRITKLSFKALKVFFTYLASCFCFVPACRHYC
nr:MAG TPA: hypothetical protein [Bacteriophage sp.]